MGSSKGKGGLEGVVWQKPRLPSSRDREGDARTKCSLFPSSYVANFRKIMNRLVFGKKDPKFLVM
jgi:hypothetical protein